LPAKQSSLLFNRLIFQSGEDGIQLFAFDVGGGSGDDVSGDAAQDVSFVGRKFRRQFRDEIARNGGKSISIVKTEGRQPVTFQADFKRLDQGEFPGLISVTISQSNEASQGLTRHGMGRWPLQ
jgi:hypothetical protein